MKLENKKVKYVVLLIVCLLIMLFGSSLMAIVLIRPLMAKTGQSAETINTAIEAFQNYFSAAPYNEVQTWSEFAQDYFAADPVLFANIKTFFCTLQFLSYVPLLILIIFFLREEFAEDFIAFKKNIKKYIPLIALGVVAMYGCSIVIGIIYEIIGVTGESNNESIINLLLDSPGVVLMVVAVVILAPITEEVIFRKLLFGTCEVTCKFPPAVAIIASALAFSLIHVTDLESLKFIFQYLALALPICIVYHHSGNNIFVTISMHVINNLISVIVTLLMS